MGKAVMGEALVTALVTALETALERGLGSHDRVGATTAVYSDLES